MDPASQNSPKSDGNALRLALISAVVSVLGTAGTLGVAYVGGAFQVTNTETANRGSLDLEELKFSNELVKGALEAENPANSLKFYAEIGLLEGLIIEKIKEYADKEQARIDQGGEGESLLPVFGSSNRSPLWLSRDFFADFTPNANKDIVDALISTGNYLISGYRINDNINRLAMFLGMIAFETGGFRYLEEMGTKENINARYSNKIGNGSVSSGDGWKYRGRGYIQITGRSNYERFSQETGVDIIENPDIAANPHVGILIALSFWTSAKLENSADEGDISFITRKVNGSLHALEQRREYFLRAKSLLNAIEMHKDKSD